MWNNFRKIDIHNTHKLSTFFVDKFVDNVDKCFMWNILLMYSFMFFNWLDTSGVVPRETGLSIIKIEYVSHETLIFENCNDCVSHETIMRI